MKSSKEIAYERILHGLRTCMESMFIDLSEDGDAMQVRALFQKYAVLQEENNQAISETRLDKILDFKV